MISVYGRPGDRRGQGTVGPGNRMFRIIRISRCIRSFRDIRGFRDIWGFRGLPDHPEYPEPPGHIHRYWMAGLEILDDGLMNTAWQANR